MKPLPMDLPLSNPNPNTNPNSNPNPSPSPESNPNTNPNPNPSLNSNPNLNQNLSPSTNRFPILISTSTLNPNSNPNSNSNSNSTPTPSSSLDSNPNPSTSTSPVFEHCGEERGGSAPPQAPVQCLIDLVSEISVIGEYRKQVKKECANLTRWVKLLSPLFEELRETEQALPEQGFRLMELALRETRELLRLCHQGSKIYLVMERVLIVNKLMAATAQLEQALDGFPYKELEISDEVREQVELVHAQLRRAKASVDSLDTDLCNDLATVLSEDSEMGVQMALKRVATKLQLTSRSETRQELKALQIVFARHNGTRRDSLEQMSLLLRKLDDLSAKEHTRESIVPPEHCGFIASDEPSTPAIPDDFKCPISLELMKDPVIVATGQTYDRSGIQKWLDAGNRTCPKTQQVLPHLILTSNCILRSLIYQWCEENRVELPKRDGPSKLRQSVGGATLDITPEDRQTVDSLLHKLQWGEPDVQRAAAQELRYLAKRNAEFRVCIAEAGAIPHLVSLLSTADMRVQEHAVTALLNLSIHESNKGTIMRSGAVEPIIEVLRMGGIEARENAAAILFSLSVVDDYKITIGASGAIPALVNLLQEGSLRGRKDAMAALFNLSIYQGNRAQIVSTGAVPLLLQFLSNPGAEMVDEALAILAVLATHPSGRATIGGNGNTSASPSPVSVLLDLIQTVSPRNKENAVAILLALCQHDAVHVCLALQLEAAPRLAELVQTGTSRARRKAITLLSLLNKQVQMAPYG